MGSFIVPALSSFNAFLQQDNAGKLSRVESMRNRRRQDKADELQLSQEERARKNFEQTQKEQKLASIVKKIIGTEGAIPTAEDFSKVKNPADLAKTFRKPLSAINLNEEDRKFAEENIDEIDAQVMQFNINLADKYMQGVNFSNNQDEVKRRGVLQEREDLLWEQGQKARENTSGAQFETGSDGGTVLRVIRGDKSHAGYRFTGGKLVPLVDPVKDKARYDADIKAFDLNGDGVINRTEADVVGLGTHLKQVQMEREKMDMMKTREARNLERSENLGKTESPNAGVRYMAYSNEINNEIRDKNAQSLQVGNEAMAEISVLVKGLGDSRLESSLMEKMYKNAKFRMRSYGLNAFDAIIEEARDLEVKPEVIERLVSSREAFKPKAQIINDSEYQIQVLGIGRELNLKASELANANNALFMSDPNFGSLDPDVKAKKMRDYFSERGKVQTGKSKSLPQTQNSLPSGSDIPNPETLKAINGRAKGNK